MPTSTPFTPPSLPGGYLTSLFLSLVLLALSYAHAQHAQAPPIELWDAPTSDAVLAANPTARSYDMPTALGVVGSASPEADKKQ